MSESLKDHPIFKLMDLDDDSSQNMRASQLITIRNSLLFAWNNKKSCLLVSNYASATNTTVQTLLCHDPPLFEVRKVICMNDSSHVAMIGSRGVCVMVLPRRFMHGIKHDAEKKDKIICKTITVAERFFTTNISVQLLQASWHPIADSSKPYLFVLSSDNTLRLFNVSANPQCATHTYNLAQNNDNLTGTNLNGSLNSIFSMYSTVTSLGETAVAFDYGQEVEWRPNRRVDLINNKQSSGTLSLLQIYILKGNGDVILLLTNLYDRKYSKGILFGPLIMLPQADDNYGTDSCSILVTKTTPPMIVIGTKSSGKVHHCIALKQDEDDPDHLPIKKLGLSDTSSNNGGERMDDINSLEPTLYVYETVQLEIVPHDNDNDDYEYFIDLAPDPSLPWRYYSCTCVGVHSISLPWLQQLSQYLLNDDDHKTQKAILVHDDPCVVEHMICTKPTSTSNPCLVRGLTIAKDLHIGPTTLLCVTADNHCTVIPLLSTLRGTSPELFINNNKQSEKDVLDETNGDGEAKIAGQDFEKYIKNLLHRDSSQPILRSGGGRGDEINEITTNEGSQMVIRATTVLREQYMLKQKAARHAISKRIQCINDLRETQLEEVKGLRKKQLDLTDTAGQIANDYEDLKERQESIMMRISNIIRASKLDDPVLSRAELNMAKELRKISDQLRPLDNKIKQVKIKHKYQEKQIKENDKNDDRSSRGSRYNEQRNRNVTEMTRSALHTTQLKQILLEEGDKIHELIKKVNNMNEQVGL